MYVHTHNLINSFCCYQMSFVNNNDWISSCQQVPSRLASEAPGSLPTGKRLVYNSDYRTDPQPPTEQQKQQLCEQNKRLTKEHVAKHGWVQIKHDDFGMSHYYYDKNTNLIHAHGLCKNWKNNDPNSVFKVVRGTHDTHLRELNGLEPADDRFAPSAFDPFCM